MTSQATICIPSNRDLIESVEPLWSAINYAQAAGMKVVISDNSGDPEKKDYFTAAPTHVTYIPDAPEDPVRNVISALSHADTEFVLLLGDDDFLSFAEGAVLTDFANLPMDIIGVKPRIVLWSPENGVTQIDDLPVEGDDAAQRVIGYHDKFKTNSTYYSFFRRRELTDIYTLFANHHPLSAGYSDWAIVYALVAAGKVIHDPSTILRYNNSRWEDMETAGQAIEGLHAAAGLPPEARAYMLMFHYMDSFVLILRQNSSLPLIEQYKAAYAVCMVFLKRLLFRVEGNPALYARDIDLLEPLKLAFMSSDPDLDRIFHLCGLIADRLKPGLKAQYDRYLVTAVRGENSH